MERRKQVFSVYGCGIKGEITSVTTSVPLSHYSRSPTVSPASVKAGEDGGYSRNADASCARASGSSAAAVHDPMCRAAGMFLVRMGMFAAVCLTPRVTSCLCASSSRAASSSSTVGVVFFGSDSFSLASLKMLQQRLQSQAKWRLTVVSAPHTQVSNFARSHLLPLRQWPVAKLEESYDVGAVVSFGHLIPETLIKQCRYGILNVHGSLLPRWRGPSPIHHAILAGDRVTGVSVMLIEPHKFDVGAIVAQQTYVMPERPTTVAVHAALSVMGAQLLLKTIEHLPQSLKQAQPQAGQGVTRAPKPKNDAGRIVFENTHSTDVDRRCRALQGLVDLTSRWVDGSTIKLADVVDPEVVQSLQLDRLIGDESPPGSIVFHKKRRILCFKCSDDRWIGFERIAMQKSKSLTALQFFNGYMSRLLKSRCPSCRLKQIRISRGADSSSLHA